jgi:FtsP/CotA-like multicopper oxidase with cupredoxin domain
MREVQRHGISRRAFLQVAGALGLSGALLGAHASAAQGREGQAEDVSSAGAEHSSHGGNETTGSVDTSRFDPTAFLRDFYWGEERQEGGRTVREYEMTAEEVEIEVAPGVMYPAWAYNGQVPGPTLRGPVAHPVQEQQ